MRLSVHELRQGDDLRRLAQRLLGDFRRWTELVRLNRLDPPYVADDPTPYRAQGLRVLGPGDRLLYPGSPAEPPAGLAALDAEAEAYGRDLALEGGYLLFLGQNPALVQGLENLRAALERRLLTRLGELPAHPEIYGHLMEQYVGQAAGEAELGYILLEAERCLRQDPRVAGLTLAGELVDREHVRLTAWVEPVPPGTPFALSLEVPR
ncbi:hypothetical protein [Thermus brockianus]